MENHLAKDVKMTDWYALLEAGRKQNSSNCLEGKLYLARYSPLLLTYQFQICRGLGEHTVRSHCYCSKALHNGPQQRVVGLGGT